MVEVAVDITELKKMKVMLWFVELSSPCHLAVLARYIWPRVRRWLS